ncbi:MAG TPA: two-component regulator propeller domain-containing protein [Puia sp.]|nr:two-component regulator propeller domain-containing protein [Puia sp.]
MRHLPRPYPIFIWGILTACVFLSSAARLSAQQQYLFSHLGTRDGLSSNVTTAIEQDPKGYIWIGTMGGLQRYDAHRFLLFRHRKDDTGSIPNDNIMALRLDKYNRLWVLCQYNKIGYIDVDDLRYHPVRVDIKETDLAKREGSIHLDFEGHILLFFRHEAPVAYDETAHVFTNAAVPFEMPKGWPATAILADPVTHTYYLGSDSGLVKYDPAHHTLSYRGHNTDHDPIIARYGHLKPGLPVIRDKSGRFWLNSWPSDGAFSFISFDLRTGKEQVWDDHISKTLHREYYEIHHTHEQKDGTLWISGVNALLTLRKNGHDFENMKTRLANEFAIYFDIVNSFFEDREDNIWLATDKGIYHFNPSGQLFHTIVNKRPEKDSAYTPEVTDILQLKNKEILVSTWGSGLFAYDSAFHPIDRWYVRQGLRLGEGGTWCIHQRPNGDIWRGEQSGILMISHAATQTTERIIPPECEHSTIRQIAEDRNGDLWLGTQRGKLIKWHAATNTFSIVRDLQSRVYRLYVDWKGDLWVCTMQNGLFHIRPSDGSILHQYTADAPEGRKLPDIGAYDIIQYSDSIYAIASNILCQLNVRTDGIQEVEHGDGIPFEGVENVVRDNQGHIWITTRDGIGKLNTRNQIRNVYQEEDGISPNAFQLAATGTLSDGRIVMGTAHDLVVFQPAEVGSSMDSPPDVEITNIAVLNKWLPMDSVSRLPELELPYGDNSVRIAFSTLTYFWYFGIIYKMDGLDKDWVVMQSNEAVYNWLPPGHYTFRIYARNSEDAVSPHMRELHITVRNPFWRTWWFLGFVLLAGAALLYWLDRQRMQRKEALEKIRSKISGNLHEEVNKALQNINVLSEIARIKADKDPQQSINYINEIHHQSHNMIIAMDDMLWSIDPANDSMDKSIDRMKEFAGALSRRHGVRIGLEADDEFRSLSPDMNIRHEFLLIYKIALRLLVEEMKVAGVLVQLDYQRPHLHLTLFSAGAHMDDRNNRCIRLLEEMRSRAQSIHGTLEMQYDEKGTAILFICPSTF